jgi:hypothetical protein
MIAHHRISRDIDGKDICQFEQSIFDPLPPVLEALAGERIFTTQKGAANATRNAMVIGVASRDTNVFLGFGMVLSFAKCLQKTTNLLSCCQ